VRAARGAKKRRDGEKKSAKTGSRQVPRFGLWPGNATLPAAAGGSAGRHSGEWRFWLRNVLLGGSSIVLAVPALQNLLFSVFVIVFPFAL
jgi:hypothetical protein